MEDFIVFCHPILLSGQMGGIGEGRAVGWSGQGESGKYDIHGATVMPLGTHTMVHATLVGYRDVQSAVGAILFNALHWYHCSCDVFEGSSNMPSRKDQTSDKTGWIDIDCIYKL